MLEFVGIIYEENGEWKIIFSYDCGYASKSFFFDLFETYRYIIHIYNKDNFLFSNSLNSISEEIKKK